VTSVWKQQEEERADRGHECDQALVAREQRGRCERKVRIDHRMPGKVAVAQRLFALAGEDQYRLRADRIRGRQVARRIPDAGNAVMSTP
jgi:hypothetical protein